MSAQETFPLRGRRIWVTGGHGFLGRHLLEELNHRGAFVLAPHSQECDLLDPGAAVRFLREHHPEGVIHLAAKVGGINANRMHPGYFFFTNMVMGLHLIEACRVESVEKTLILGTVCAYPKFTPVPFREEELWNGYPEETNAPYGIAKKALLVQLQAYRKEYGMRGIYLLPVNLYGPGDNLDPESSHVIPALIRKFLEAKAASASNVEICGTGSASREFLHVRDAARAICDGMEKYEAPEPVNLGTGEEITIRDLALFIKECTHFKGDIFFNSEHPDGQPRRRLDPSRAKTGFGWVAQIGTEKGIRETVEWMTSIFPKISPL